MCSCGEIFYYCDIRVIEGDAARVYLAYVLPMVLPVFCM